MKPSSRLFTLLALISALALPAAATAADSARIVCLGGTLTEIVFALGAGNAVVGADTSSTFPAATAQIPKVGYQRNVAAEGILALRPTLLLATNDAGPPAALQQLRDSGLDVVILPSPLSVDTTKETITAVATAIGRTDAAGPLLAAIDADLRRLPPRGNEAESPRVLFVYARGAGTLLVAGSNTAADEMIRLAGARNAVTESHGFKPLTAESVIAAAPDVVLIPSQGLQSVGGAAGLLELPGLALTPAARQRRIVALDDLYLLGFGPRVAQAALELSQQLRNPPELAPAAAQRSAADAGVHRDGR